ncbi:ChaN family lipoprotein [uncultured Bdellovibrio sp.]|uniref:ChaN family lipoprotein n=1 Tax=Bdellovibrio sp. HCB-162 TaxID=3394234 RepID=UPI0025DD65B2|nr:ChaN family lipoprotein [uncultured Bdellovibrio sp.]
MNDLQKWIRIRKDLYLQMRKQVRHRLGEDTPELMHYHKVYDKEFSKKWTASTKEALWEQMAQSQVVMVGDFHALHQSQKAQVRILRHIPKDRKIILAVEFFEAADQEKINKYLSGKISEREFLKSVQWQSKWGFPWEHYRPLLRWAQKHKISVQGLNKSYKKRNAATLKSRDVFAGKKIAELIRQNPEHLVFVIYGDLHLASSHIPKEIENNLGRSFGKKILRIFQNAEQIYFQLLNRELEATTDLVRISQNTFCLMSVPPWVKWQNYLMYLEQAYDVELDDDDDDDDDSFLDYTDHVGRYVKIISEELGLPVTDANLSVYTARDTSFWSQVREHYDAKKLRWIESLIAEEMSFYLPEIGAAYLARGTVNHAASLAMRYVHAQSSGTKRLLTEMPQDFFGFIWLEGVAYFGSKIINHKRKTDTVADIKASLSSRGPSDLGKEALQLALAQKMHELMVITGVPQHRLQANPRKKWSYVLAANLLGGMLGERLYGGYRKKMISPATIVNFLKKSVDGSGFNVAYYDLLEVIESLPAPFHSKREKL